MILVPKYRNSAGVDSGTWLINIQGCFLFSVFCSGVARGQEGTRHEGTRVREYEGTGARGHEARGYEGTRVREVRGLYEEGFGSHLDKFLVQIRG